jgi:hypothetical protein
MTSSDRAFLALAHREPGAVAALLRALTPRLVPAAGPVSLDDLSPTRLDALAPPRDADAALRFGEGGPLVHVECQGYRDGAFADRLLWYHLSFALLHRPRPVKTVALWLMRPPPTQRPGVLAWGDIRVRATQVLVPDVPAERLLASPGAACFAPAADPGGRTVRWLCDQAAARLRAEGASYYQRHMAVVCAATQGRYGAMVEAMANEGLEPVIIEDLVKFGEDRGRAEGEARGRAEGEARALLAVLEARGLAVSDAERARIVRCADAAQLERWVRRAVTARATAELFDDESK